MKRSSVLRAALAVLAWAATTAAPLTALAQTYPNRAVRIVVPYPPGSSPDALARIVGEQLGRQIGQNVIVENRAGAGGMIGAKAVSEAPTDGATLLMFTPAWSAARVFIKNPPIPVPEGLEPVTMVAEGRFVFMASAALPARDFNEMVAHARANPGKLNFATTGLGDSLLYFHDLAAEKGLKIETVQYKGSAEYVSALFANDVQLAFTPEYSMLPHVRAGKMKPLAITGATRSRAYPDTPTFDELGLPRVRNNWFALFAPRGTSAEIVARQNADLTAAIRSADVSRRIRELYFEPTASSAEQLRRRIDTEIDEWTRLARKVGIEPQ